MREGDIRECIKQAVHELLPLALEKEVKVEAVRIQPPGAPLYFEASQIEQVLINLLDNACKFTPSGGSIEVTAGPYFWERRFLKGGTGPANRRGISDPSPNSYRIDIKDTGPGVPPDHAARIFEEYTSYAGARDRSGGGLGLAICRLILSRHNGQIWVDSHENGAVFSFVLPYKRGSQGNVSSSRSLRVGENMNSGVVRKTILVGEDDREVRNYLEVTLRCRGYDVKSAPDGEGVLNYLRSGGPVSAVLLDIIMPNKDGFETLREVREMNASLPVIMLSGMATPLNIVQAMKSGATDFLAKPVSHEDLSRMIQRATEAPEPPQSAPPTGDDDMFFGVGVRMQALRLSVPKVAASDVPVLIQGETGTGKAVLARQVHLQSSRADRPFVKLNCGAVPADLMESELFGYERGAFTGAFQRKPGVFELADGGTILLDEIGDMDLKLQVKLLQVLQDHEFRRLGGRETVRVDVRVLAATHRDLFDAIHANRFREDLYYRLNVLTLTLPPLRERKEDIIGMAEFFIRRHSSREVPPVVLTPRLKEVFLAYDWPGNIRQLENIVRKLMVLRDPDFIIGELDAMRLRHSHVTTAEAAPQPEAPRPDFHPKASPTGPGSILERVTFAKQEAEAAAILDALNATRWNRKQAAARLNIDYKALLYKMKKLSMDDRAARASSIV